MRSASCLSNDTEQFYNSPFLTADFVTKIGNPAIIITLEVLLLFDIILLYSVNATLFTREMVNYQSNMSPLPFRLSSLIITCCCYHLMTTTLSNHDVAIGFVQAFLLPCNIRIHHSERRMPTTTTTVLL